MYAPFEPSGEFRVGLIDTAWWVYVLPSSFSRSCGRRTHSVGSIEQFERFRRVVLADPELQARLRSIEDWPAFVDATVAAAADHGVALTPEAVLAARDECRRSWLERWV